MNREVDLYILTNDYKNMFQCMCIPMT